MKNKVMKTLCMLLCLILIVLTAACGGSTTETQGTPEGGAPEASVEPVIVKVTHNNSPLHHQGTLVLEPFAAEVTELTEGRVQFEFYPSAALGPANTHYDMAINGIAGMAFTLQSLSEGKFPLTSVINLPLLADSTHEAAEIFYGLYEKFPEFAAEYKDVKFLWNTNNDAEVLFTREKPITSMADIKGLKIRTSSNVQNPVIEAWGGTPISMPMSDCYDAMQRGVIDGMIGPYSVIGNFKLGDVTKYILDEPFFYNNFVCAMSPDLYNGLSDHDKQVIDQLAEKYAPLSLDIYVQDGESGKQLAKDQGVQFTTLSDSERQKLRDAAAPTFESWIAENAAKGLPAQEVYDEAIKLAQ